MTKEIIRPKNYSSRYSLILIAGMTAALIFGIFQAVLTPGVSASTGDTLIYFLPLPEPQVRSALLSLYGSTGSTIHSVTSIVATSGGTIIYYDHWEDGYELDITIPSQATTQIWGDDDPSNGAPPGFPADIIGAGSVIALENDVPLPRNPAVVVFDGRDKLRTSNPIAVTRAAWAISPGPVLAGAVEVYESSKFGTRFEVPIGQDTSANSMFEHTSLLILAASDNTEVQIDRDGNGSTDITTTLNQGETYHVNGGILTGAILQATYPVQAHLITGDVGAQYESRFYTLYPSDRWSDSYFNPVGTTISGDPVDIFIYNPNPGDIVVTLETQTGTTNLNIPAGQVVRQTMPLNSGAHLSTTGGQSFFALGAVDSDAASNATHDWGFSLVAERFLTSMVVVGWGPGTSDLTANGSPVWLTAVQPTTIYVDYDGDPATGPQIDTNGNHYNVSQSVSAFESARLYDNTDNNQTGMTIYTLDGTLISAAWGQDPATAGSGNPYLDLGTSVLPLPIFSGGKTAQMSNDLNANGFVDPGDTLIYTISAINDGYIAVDIVVSDTLPAYTGYVTGTTAIGGSLISDDLSGTPFPLDEGGYAIGSVGPGQTLTVTFQVTLNDPLPPEAVDLVNQAIVSSGQGAEVVAGVVTPIGGTDSSLSFTDEAGSAANLYLEDSALCVVVTDPDENIDSGLAENLSVEILNLMTGDRELLVLVETGPDTSQFSACLPTSSTGGQAVEDGLLFAIAGDSLLATYVDSDFPADTSSDTASIYLPTLFKPLYFSEPGQGMDRIDPVATRDFTTSTGPELGLTGGDGTITIRDNVNYASYNGSYGLQPWTSPWTETGELDGPTAGDLRSVRENQCPSGDCLWIQAQNTGRGLARQLDLSQAITATLTFDYNNEQKNSTVQLQASTDSGLSWFPLATYNLNTLSPGLKQASLDLTPHIAPDTRIRFYVTSAGDNPKFWVDNLQVAYTNAANTFLTAARDNVNYESYTGSYGLQPWTSPWTETGELDGPTTGDLRSVRENQCPSGDCLRIQAQNTGRGLARQLDLSQAITATLTFDYNNEQKNSTVQLQASTDSGLSWTPLATYNLNTLSPGLKQASLDLTPHIAPDTRIRFYVTSASDNPKFWVDNLQVAYTYAANTFLTAARDNVNYESYTGSYGLQPWTSLWTETGELDGPTAGDLRSVRENQCPSGDCLRIQAQNTGRGLARQLDLSQAITATLTFDYNNEQKNSTVQLQASTDSGLSWFPLATYNLNTLSPGLKQASLDLTPHIAPDTRIRFYVTSAGDNPKFWVDNLQVAAFEPAGFSGQQTATFTQTLAMAGELEMPASGLITVTTFVSITAGGFRAPLEINARVMNAAADILSLSYPASQVVSGNINRLDWTGILGSDLTIPAGAHFAVEITTNEPGVSFIILSDSANFPSQVALPTTTVIDIDTLEVYDAPYPGGEVQSGAYNDQAVYIRSAVYDPFGPADIVSATLQIISPELVTTTVTLTDTHVVSMTSKSKIFETPWLTPVTQGTYEIHLTAHEGYEGITDRSAHLFEVTYLDPGTPSTASLVDTLGNPVGSYDPNESICVEVLDTDQNADPGLAETITASISSTTGDMETITLLETGLDTGIFRGCLPADVFTGTTPGDGTLHAPPASVITATYTDPDDGDDTSTDTAVINTLAPELSLAKTLADPLDGTAVVSDTVQYDLLLSNPGPTPLVTITLTDTFESDCLLFQAASLPPTTISPAVLTWEGLGPIPPGGSQTVSVWFEAVAACTAADNIGLASGIDEFTTGVGPVSDNALLDITRPELAVRKLKISPPAGTLDIGETVSYRIDITNTGTTDIPTLPVSDSYSDFCLAYQSATPAPDGAGGGSILWNNLGPLSTGLSSSIMVTFTVAGPCSPAINTAIIDSAVDEHGDPVPLAQDEVSILTLADPPQVALHKSLTDPRSGFAAPGDPLTFTVQLTNTGLTALTRLVITDTYDAGCMTLTSANISPTAAIAGQAVWDTLVPPAPPLLPTQVITLTLGFSADAYSAGCINSVSTTGWDQFNQTLEPVTSTAQVQIREADLAISKFSQFDAVAAGDNLTYTLTITNYGPSSASGVVVTDTLPSGLTYSEAAPLPISGPNPLVWNLGTLLPGETQTITMVTLVNSMATGMLTNTVQVQANEPDPDLANNDSAETNLVIQPALMLDLNATPGSLLAGQVVTLTYQVTNTGDTYLGPIIISDTILGPVCNQPGPLAPGAGFICVFTSTVMADTTYLGTVTAQPSDNTGSALPGVNPINAGDSAFVDVLPTADVSFSVAPASLPEPGGTVTYTLSLTNTATEPLTLTALSDTLLGGLHGQGDCALPQTLAVGAAYTCQYSTAVSGNAGETLPNTLTATAQDDEGNPVVENALATVTFTDALPAIDVSFSAAPASLPEPGGTVTYTLSLTNTSTEPLTLTALSDTLLGDLHGQGDCALPQTLAVGAAYTCQYSAAVSGNAGETLPNTLTATAQDDEGNPVVENASTSVTFTDALPSWQSVSRSNLPRSPSPAGR